MVHIKNNKGFTLLELVIVIIILGILSAVAIPHYLNIQKEAKIAATKGKLAAIRGGIELAHAKIMASGINTGPTGNNPDWPTLEEIQFNELRLRDLTHDPGPVAISDAVDGLYTNPEHIISRIPRLNKEQNSRDRKWPHQALRESLPHQRAIGNRGTIRVLAAASQRYHFTCIRSCFCMGILKATGLTIKLRPVFCYSEIQALIIVRAEGIFE